MDVGQMLVGGGIGAIVLAAVQAWINRKKMGADTAAVLTKAATELVQPLMDRIHELEAQVNKLTDRATQAVNRLDECQERCRAKDALISELTRGA